jgi:hypothetical protein
VAVKLAVVSVVAAKALVDKATGATMAAAAAVRIIRVRAGLTGFVKVASPRSLSS